MNFTAKQITEIDRAGDKLISDGQHLKETARILRGQSSDNVATEDRAQLSGKSGRAPRVPRTNSIAERHERILSEIFHEHGGKPIPRTDIHREYVRKSEVHVTLGTLVAYMSRLKDRYKSHGKGLWSLKKTALAHEHSTNGNSYQPQGALFQEREKASV